MTTEMNPTREGFHTITPYLMIPEAERFVEFLREAFGATELYRAKGSAGGWHIELKVGDSMLMVGEAKNGPAFPAALFLYLQDVDAVYHRALKAGATSLSAPQDQSFGDRMAGVKDDFGNTWYLATHLGGH